MISKLKTLAVAGVGTLAATPAFAAAPEAAEAAATIAKGDTAFMFIATVLVMAMIVPGLALFYGGLARTKNMASVLTQVLGVAALAFFAFTMFRRGPLTFQIDGFSSL